MPTRARTVYATKSRDIKDPQSRTTHSLVSSEMNSTIRIALSLSRSSLIDGRNYYRVALISSSLLVSLLLLLLCNATIQ